MEPLKNWQPYSNNYVNVLLTDESIVDSTREHPSFLKNHIYILVLQSRTLVFRIFALSVCWMTMLFTYYGLSLDSVSIGGNRYLSFILVSLVEIPAYVVSLWLPDVRVIGRRWATAGSFFFTAAACLLFYIWDKGSSTDALLFLSGKFSSTFTMTILYIYTSEVFPTEARASLLLVCSTIGRIGQMFVPQIPLLKVNSMIVFSIVSLVGGVFALSCPETLNTRLPDTIQEA